MDDKKKAGLWAWAARNKLASTLLAGVILYVAPQYLPLAKLVGKGADQVVAEKAAEECAEHGGCE